VLAGARSIAAIAEWAADAPQPIRAALAARRDAPDHFAVPAEATIRRALSRLDVDALAAAVGAWLADRDRDPGPAGTGRRRAVAIDGKTLRGARPPAPDGDGRPVHLLAAMDHTSRAVLAQRQVGGAPEEVPTPAPLLAPLGLAGVVVTADALQTHPEAAEFLVIGKRAHYLFVVKANQPTLLDRCQRLPWHRVPELDRTRDRGHGRIEVRTLKAVSVHHFGFPPRRPSPPGHPQDPRPARPSPAVHERDGLRHHQPHPCPGRPRPARRPHPWALGDRGAAPHSRHHLRRGRLPSPHRRRPQRDGGVAQPSHRGAQSGGPVNIAAALRRHARNPRRPLATLGISLG
jgi:hypothetical protein